MKVRGSLTVEATLILPVILFCILLVLNQGLELYSAVIATAGKQEMLEESDPAERFRILKLSEEMTG